MERSAAARRAIFNLWQETAKAESVNQGDLSDPQQQEVDANRLGKLRALLEEFNVGVETPLEEDVCRGLGDALDRLILLCVPLTAQGVDVLETVLLATGRLGRKMSVRTVQHLFARARNYSEALAIFYAMRRCHFSMNMDTYHAMLYSLQRLEEEGWAQRFHDERKSSKDGCITEQALDFVLRGVDNQLVPESKPWLGRIMFAESAPNDAATRQSRESFDALGKMWAERYHSGASRNSSPSN